jgi:CRISPR system Cascade subunit CasE
MPYLSRVYMNPLRTSAQRLLSNPHRMHAAVLGGLSRQPVAERVLWRLETAAHRATLLVLTQSTPSWEHLIEQAGWTAADEPQAEIRSYEPLLARIERDREFRFRLRVNPVSSTMHPQKPSEAHRRQLDPAGRRRGVRVAHRTAAHQLTWLMERVDKWGFTMPSTADGRDDVRVQERNRLVFVKNGTAGGRRVVIQTATFEGRLRIEDPDRARSRLLEGVGAARAYGCGLITLAPVRS